MKRIMLILLAIVGLAFIGENQSVKAQRGNKHNQKDAKRYEKHYEKDSKNKRDYVEVIYFYDRRRTATCRAIEKLTREVVGDDFSRETRNGNVKLRVVDITYGDGRRLADRYNVRNAALYVNKWSQGSERRDNITGYAASRVLSSPRVFKEELRKKIVKLLD